MKTPGQAAYEEFISLLWIPPEFKWTDLNEEVHAGWEAIAQAAIRQHITTCNLLAIAPVSSCQW